jgi:hypothetical protein
MNLSALFSTTALGGGVRFFFASTSWTVPATGTYRIQAWGGSGTGAVARGGSVFVTGGGGGAKCTKTVKLTAGDVLAFTVGAGGALNQLTANGQANGNDGGDTTITGPNGLNMVAGGGKGGKYATTVAVVDGGAGGIASGGDENLSGGRGGSILTHHPNTIGRRATGGGGLPVVRDGWRGGDISCIVNVQLATGGAGAGGRGGDVLSTVTAAGATGGGGAITRGIDLVGTENITAGGKALLAIAAPGKVDVPLTPWFPYSGEGTVGTYSSSIPSIDGGPGGGSGGAVNSASGAMTSKGPGIFGGSGGAISGVNATSGSLSTANTFIGGSGGATGAPSTGGCTAAAGGDGWIIVERLS